ncbi:hypothetical protein [Acinetobacter silvestris]|uniref:Uncharacterized protein n=1 Tax=Acinetobacter silvestris TaxID=1977882 RepID=A0A1Y3CH90_9GAMM|nr:hypothetical protein [Acinetobacter silvestris]OTG65982.1 hypothetical protein B9T28_07230 [Acinetobacter silvestris]
MQSEFNQSFEAQGEAFSIATLMYARLRRMFGRIIDVMYVVQDKDYACYVIAFAIATEDDELKRLASRMQALIEQEVESQSKTSDALVQQGTVIHPIAEQTEIIDEVYQAQISHHYIGALR